ncbi:chloride channel protein [Gloeomargarita lithophora Alchichica-D10]|uniref:Chloride channel protein n=1 Tax=Gloeomargarita lithophora Alchichica-D10 TaxID=1188229 RepID=A0A1J0ADW4_9CYAN|nr:H(+)/Cl(-) exchange transporter ClcA [Gloeomargarita lithophora]APB34124.1 chloride channel protein [Gloeomargarita lithophora Alchichica-D10]
MTLPESYRPGVVLGAALITGIMVGLVGGGFRQAVSWGTQTRFDLLAALGHSSGGQLGLALGVSVVMVLAGFWLMRWLAPETGGSGIPQIEGFLAGKLPLRSGRVLPVKFVAGWLMLVSGMVLGREGPTIQMGGSMGHLTSRWGQLSQEESRVLVAAGAAAGLTAAFNAPLAGILFVLEEMRPRFQNDTRAYQGITLACVMVMVVVQALGWNETVLPVKIYGAPPWVSLWVFALTGAALGVIGYVFNRGLVLALDILGQSGRRFFSLQAVIFGGLVGVLGYIYQPSLGSNEHLYHPLISGGEQVILWSLDRLAAVPEIWGLFLLRLVMTLLCYGSGAPGGIFAPLLAIATLFSQGLGREVYALFPQWLPEPGILTIAGMGGLVAATVRAPLTAIVLTLEITGNYQLILPLLVTCLTATLTAQYLGGEPIYEVLLARMLGQNRAH